MSSRPAIPMLAALARMRIPAALLAGALGLLAPLMLLDSDRSSGDPPLAALVSVDLRHPGRAVPRRFLGLSFELAALGRLDSLAADGDLVTLLRSLGPGLLRLGGASADTRVAWVDARTPRPPWASVAIDRAQLRTLGWLARRSGWRVLLTLGLAHFEPRAAAREAAAAKAQLGPWLAGVEIGNEPDAYARHHLRGSRWSYRRYAEQVRAYRRAIARLAGHVPIAGPGVSGSHAFRLWGSAEASGLRPALLTGHHYPLGCHQDPPPSIERLLSEQVGRLEAASLRRFVAVARRRRLAVRIDETNTVSCGGLAGVSDTFAAALWAVRFIQQAIDAGASGINLHGNPDRCSGYSPLCVAPSAQPALGELHPQPEWYALLLTRALAGARPLRTSISAPQLPNVSVSALLARDATLRFLIVDDEAPSGDAATLRLQVGRGYRSGSVLLLSAPAPTATAGVLLAGSAVRHDGSWREPPLPSVPVRAGTVSLTLAPSSAALVTLTPRAHAR